MKKAASEADTHGVSRSLQPRALVSRKYWNGGRAWAAAALLVLISAVAIAVWSDQTAVHVDRLRLERGAEAVNRNLESEIRVVEMAANVIVAAAAAAENPEVYASLAATNDPEVLDALVGLVVYPIADTGTGEGDVFFEVYPEQEVIAPDLGLPGIVTDKLVEEDVPYLSPAYTDPGSDEVRMVVVVPVDESGSPALVGAIFLPYRILENAVTKVAVDEYAAALLDQRFSDQVVTSIGTPTGSDIIRSSPVGMAGLVDVEVMAGSAFPYSRSPLIPFLSLTIGATISLLLLGMALLTRARTREMNERLELARAQDEGKDRFLATVSHELRTPLTVVLGGATEVQSQWQTLPPEERKELLGMVADQALEASNLVEDLLVVARSEYGNVKIAMANTDLQRHLSYAMESVPADREGTFSVTAEDPIVYADGTRLRQILRNLVHNAVAHGGPNISVEVAQLEDTVEVSVFDDGGPLSIQDCDRIFEPYARTDGAQAAGAQGIGIGLYVSRLLAQLMGGDLACLRTNGQTEFRLTLPVGTASGVEIPEPVDVPEPVEIDEPATI